MHVVFGHGEATYTVDRRVPIRRRDGSVGGRRVLGVEESNSDFLLLDCGLIDGIPLFYD